VDALAGDVAERSDHHALALQARLAGKGGAFDDHAEMRFAGAVVAHMATVAGAVVDHIEMIGRERGGEPCGDFVGKGSGHDPCIKPRAKKWEPVFVHGGVAPAQGATHIAVPDPPEKITLADAHEVAAWEREMTQDRFHGRMKGTGRLCDAPGCPEPGEFRAPSGQGSGFDGPGSYRWFCLDHVRAFNQGYDFFRGMSRDEIERAQSPLAGWASETRAFRPNAGIDETPRWADFADPLDAIAARASQRRQDYRRAQDAQRLGLNPVDRQAYDTLGLDFEDDRRALRARYTELVRRYHPDRNGGDRTHEDALREVVEAYQHLRKLPAFS